MRILEAALRVADVVQSEAGVDEYQAVGGLAQQDVADNLSAWGRHGATVQVVNPHQVLVARLDQSAGRSTLLDGFALHRLRCPLRASQSSLKPGSGCRQGEVC